MLPLRDDQQRLPQRLPRDSLDDAERRVRRAETLQTTETQSWLTTRRSSRLGLADVGVTGAGLAIATEEPAIDQLTAIVWHKTALAVTGGEEVFRRARCTASILIAD